MYITIQKNAVFLQLISKAAKAASCILLSNKIPYQYKLIDKTHTQINKNLYFDVFCSK